MEHGTRPRTSTGQRKSETTVYDISAPLVALLKLLCTRAAMGVYTLVLGVFILTLPGLQNIYLVPEARLYELQSTIFQKIGFLFIPVAVVTAIAGILVTLRRLYLIRLYARQLFSATLFLFFLTGLFAEQTITPNSLYPKAENYLLAGDLGDTLRSGLLTNTIWIIAGLTCAPLLSPRRTKMISKLVGENSFRAVRYLVESKTIPKLFSFAILILRRSFEISRQLYRFVTARLSKTPNTSAHIPQENTRAEVDEVTLLAGPRTDSLIKTEPSEKFVISSEVNSSSEEHVGQTSFVAEMESVDDSITKTPSGPLSADSSWLLPPLALLRPGDKHAATNQGNDDRAQIIEQTLASHGVDATVSEINEGPAITQFGITPGWDVKTRKLTTKDKNGEIQTYEEEISRSRVRVKAITALQNDLALALATPEIRIEAPVPGKPIIGLEVPNSNTRLVMLRDVLDSPEWQRSKNETTLGVPLGADISGRAMFADLTKMPHLLIAGATGSGKSVCLNAIISGLLMQHTPETLRLVLIDPKRVEMTAYASVPHLAFSEIITDLDRVLGTLQAVANEMDARYRKFQALGVRNIEGYNEKTTGDPLPYWVVVIDELADLMMTAPDQVQRLLVRLAQLARATGIHVIVATQRPSVDVITGLIKANFPTRIAFAVSSIVDSRTIIDGAGAEKLLGRGDMLYVPPGADKPRRIQGVFVSDNEIASVTDYWLADNFGADLPEKHDYALEEAVQQAVEELALIDSSNEDSGQSPDDPQYKKALILGAETGQLSTSMLQRKLGIGYPRAARLMDQLEENGIVGPPGPAGKPRQVISLGSAEREDPARSDVPTMTNMNRLNNPPKQFDSD
jgi:hypothetical protein